MRTQERRVAVAGMRRRLARLPVAVAAVSTQADLAELGRFRYRVYVQQTGKNARWADHQRRSLIEPLDAVSTNLTARDKAGALLGAVRITVASRGWQLPEPLRPAPWSWLPPANVAHVSRLAVDASARQRGLTMRLCCECFQWGCDHGISLSTVFCAPPLRAFFEKCGYVAFDSVFADAYAGGQVPMVLCLADRDHLAAVGSPFGEWAAARPAADGRLVAMMEALRRQATAVGDARRACATDGADAHGANVSWR